MQVNNRKKIDERSLRHQICAAKIIKKNFFFFDIFFFFTLPGTTARASCCELTLAWLVAQSDRRKCCLATSESGNFHREIPRETSSEKIR